MQISELRAIIENKTARLAVIGLGYVGLPVAVLFAEAGFNVLGVELRSERVEKINRGISPIEGDEPGLKDLLRKVTADGRLKATISYQDLNDRDVILLDVETPTDEQHIPQYAALRAAMRDLGGVLKPGALVIVESTIAPRTMAELVCPALEKSSGRKVNEGFYLGNCPERVMPGKLIANLRSLSRVAGGGTPETAETMIALYRHVVKADLDAVDWITAELVKTVENAYRDVQIAFANEVALVCEAVGGDVWKVRELVNKSPYRQMHLPGGGVGGHCIPKDPWLLAYGVRDRQVPLRLIPAARAINDSMPQHVAELVRKALEKEGLELNRARILVLGYAYLENSDDTRNSPSETLVQYLKKQGADVVIHDPYVEEYCREILQAVSGCDAVIVMVKHQEYLDLDWKMAASSMRHKILVDARMVTDAQTVKNAGFSYSLVGESTG